jgi:8-oxo-dGTP pyrophosphatase MutT (NUDIX family)
MKDLDQKATKLNPWVELIETQLDTDPYHHFKVPDYVFILAMTSNKQVVLVRQFRIPQNCVTLELPAGLVDFPASPRETAIKELKEETNVDVADKIIELPTMTLDSGRIENKTYSFIFLDVEKPQESKKKSELETVWVEGHELLELALTGKIDHMGQVAVILWAYSEGYF